MPFPFPFTLFGANRSSNVPSGVTCDFTYCYGGDWVRGKVGNYGMNFGGRYGLDYVSIPDNSSIQFGDSDDFTVACWVSSSTGEYYQGFVSKKTNAAVNYAGWTLFRYADAHEKMGVSIGSAGADRGFVYTDDPLDPDDTWHHLVMTRNGTSKVTNLWLDGVEQADSTTAPLDDSGTNMRLGQWWTTGTDYGLDGKLDEVGIWNVVLTPAQISLLSTGSARADSFTPPNASDGDWSTGIYKKIGTYGVGPGWGSSDYISASWDSEIDFGNADDFSWSFWLYPTSFDSYNWIMAKESAAYTGGYYCSLYSAGVGKVIWGSYATGNPQNISTTALNLNSWNHVVVTKGTGTNYLAYKIYINGVVSGYSTNSGNNTGDPSGYPLTIGRREAGLYPFAGYMDDIAIFNTELASGDVLELYNSGSALTGALASGVRTSALKAYWDFENPGPGSTTISGSRGLDATMMGSMDGGTTGSLVLYYDFEIGDSNPVSGNFPTSTTVYDVVTASFHGPTAHTGTMTNMSVADFGAWEQGQVGKYSLVFDGVSDYVNIPSASQLPLGKGAGDMSVAAWCKQGALTNTSWMQVGFPRCQLDGDVGLGQRWSTSKMDFAVGGYGQAKSDAFCRNQYVDTLCRHLQQHTWKS